MILIYVDDVIAYGNNVSFMIEFLSQLHTTFALKDLRPLHFFLGVEVSRDASGFILSQEEYIHDLLNKVVISQCAACPTSIAVGKNIFAFEGEPLSNPEECRSIIKALQYLTYTRPDISFTNNLS